ncbi:BA75_00018T0 [Komagataella pastoris]|uniref:BA75_00018T0 n=1 Tax=Komagataella pastoris TaxID=4922 RepID=A0A1B2J595_PICPA|nr:BA75_00018T0 [Komagataella pastoris]
MKTEKKLKRTFLACDICRSKKLKCINNGSTKEPCHRCNRLSHECSYTPTQSHLRKHVNKDNWASKQSDYKVSKPIVPSRQVVIPEKDVVLEVVELFFSHQYQGVFLFLHRPSLLAFIKSSEFNPSTYIDDYYNPDSPGPYHLLHRPDPVVLLAIFALSARFHPSMVSSYGAFDQSQDPDLFTPSSSNGSGVFRSPVHASEYFAYHARKLLQPLFDRPSIQRIQALTMLSSHDWGERNVARAFIYVGLACRMAFILGLNDSTSLCYNETNPLITEVKRRTLWAVYLQDRCISSGRNRSSCIKIEDIHIEMPATEAEFVLGKLSSPRLTCQEFQSILFESHGSSPTGVQDHLPNVSTYCFTIFLFEVWASLARWVGESGPRSNNLPTSSSGSSSKFSETDKKLDILESTIPVHLYNNTVNFQNQASEGTLMSFVYMHALLYLSRIFLHREYFFINPETLPANQWYNATRKFLQSVERSTKLISAAESINMMVIAPFTGFELFTNAATSLYFLTSPLSLLKKNYEVQNKAAYQSLKSEVKTYVKTNIELLKKWSSVWPITSSWFLWTLDLQTSLKSFSTDEQGIMFRNLMIDYGTTIVAEEANENSSATSSLSEQSNQSTQHFQNLVSAEDNVLTPDINNIVLGWRELFDVGPDLQLQSEW